MPPIVTSHQTSNAHILNECIAPLYLEHPVLDMTYAAGSFWKGYGEPDVRIDIQALPKIDLQADCRCLPFADRSFATVVFDPPYGNGSTAPRKCGLSKQYGLPLLRTPKGIRAFYEAGIKEAYRVLRPKGHLIIKAQDMVNSGVQNWHHLHIMNFAMENGFRGEDLFVFTQTGTPMMRHTEQLHARKNHSFTLVFRKKER